MFITFSFSFLFFRKSFRLSDNMEKYGRDRQLTDTNMAHALACPIPKSTNIHSEYVNTCCFSTTAMVTQTRLNILYMYVAGVVIS
jgi:hypothetical protein